MDVLDESKYQHKTMWRRRVRNAPSAPSSDHEIHLYVLWNPVGRKERPTKSDWNDPLLWSVWMLGSGMVFKVVEATRGGNMYPKTGRYFTDKKEALAEYKRLVKDFPRSKDVDYEFPLDDSPSE